MDGYGSTRFQAEVPGITTPWGDHSQYYTRGGESLFSMSDIVSGHGDALDYDGMTAPHRIHVPDIVATVPGMPSTIDPKSSAPAPPGTSTSSRTGLDANAEPTDPTYPRGSTGDGRRRRGSGPDFRM